MILAVYIGLAYDLDIIRKSHYSSTLRKKKVWSKYLNQGEAKIIVCYFVKCFVFRPPTLTFTGSHGPLLVYVEGACTEQLWELVYIPECFHTDQCEGMNLAAYLMASDLFVGDILLTHSCKAWSMRCELLLSLSKMFKLKASLRWSLAFLHQRLWPC